MAKWAAGILATVIGAVVIWLLTDSPSSPLIPRTPVPPTSTYANALLGDWAFVRFDKGGPTSAGPMSAEFKTLRFFQDGAYTATYTVSAGPGQSMEGAGSGKYSFVNDNTLRFEFTGGQGALSINEMKFSISKDELKLSDPTSTMVFKRIS